MVQELACNTHTNSVTPLRPRDHSSMGSQFLSVVKTELLELALWHKWSKLLLRMLTSHSGASLSIIALLLIQLRANAAGRAVADDSST